MSRKQFSKSDIKKFIALHPAASEIMDKKSAVAQDGDILFVNNQPLYLRINDSWLPSLKFLVQKIVLPKVVVDKGAIKFVVNGADIMRPGITACDVFSKGDIVVIVDETVGKPIAVGKAMLSSTDLLAKKEGKVIKNLHFIGDEYWQK